MEAFLFGSNYVDGGPTLVAIGFNDAGGPSLMLDLTLSQTGTDS